MDIGLPFMLDLTPNTLCAMLVVVAMLILASITQLLLRSRLSEDGYLELKQRINSWWVMVGVVFTALMIGPNASLIFFTILSFIALREFFSILPVRVTDRRLILALYLAVPLQYYWVGMGWYGMFIVFIPVYLFLLIPFGLLMLGETKGFIRAVGSYQWATMTTVFAISHVAYLLMLPAEENPAGGGVGLVIYLVQKVRQPQDCAGHQPEQDLGGLYRRRGHHHPVRRAACALADATALVAGPWRRPADRPGRLYWRPDRVSGQARPAHQGHQPADSGPRRHSRPYRQPDVHRAAVLPLPRLHHLLRSPCPCSSACPNSCSFC